MKLHYKNPEKRRGIFIWEADVNFLSRESDFNLKGLSDEKMRERAEKIYGSDALYFPASSRTNVFLFWIAQIKNWDTQKVIESSYSPADKKDYQDIENDNLIGFFDFSNNILGKKQVKANFLIESYEVELDEENWISGNYKTSSDLYRNYTRSERQLGQTDDIVAKAKEITREGSSYYAKAKRVYNWISENILVKETNFERGAVRVFQSKEGSAAEVSFLCVTMMRAIGIPSRIVVGAWGEIEKRQDPHFWLEFYLEDVGWVPVDCAKNLFAKLDNKRTIFSKGENILLEKAPEQSSYFNIGYRRTFLMRPEATYINGQGNGFFAVKENKYLLVKG